MHEDDTTDVEGVLSDKSENYEIPVMATGLDCQVPEPEANKNDVNYSVMLLRRNTYYIGKVV